ncbi:chlorophyllide reductase subunit Z [Vulcanimicrobium alpinum]|uniref:Chlorophyllide reductase subunit Z n=1 Tax=Vulcanimicrobium alpinum TaxID=3016050 RepID=A0AAN1XZ19_UNVUL|nr:nitrogenase component 1 [Vulcanimicrobium alpinum]BDE07341.1 chlorophyllide reductase subunit Z [Vulcanimicrobium alpinum]
MAVGVRPSVKPSELPSDVVNTPIRKQVTDLDHGGGDTGAMQAFASLRDVNVVLDGPVGCHVMPAVAVINYTDSIPYLQNVTCSELSENEVTITGTLPALKEKVARASVEGRQVIIVSTPVSELIGGAWTTIDEDVKGSALFFDAHALDDDEWKARDRALLFLWEHRAHFVRPADAPAVPKTKPRVHLIGPTYGCFNSYSDLAEIERLIRGIGADVGLVYPFKAASWETADLADGDALVVLYKEFGISLAREVGLPVFHAPFGLEETTTFLRGLGETLGLREQAAAFIAAEKKSTLAAWKDIWNSTHSDFFANAPIAIVAPPTYKDGLERYLGGELGLPIAFSAYRTGPESAPSDAVRAALADASPSPMLVLGSINERMIVAQERMPSRFMQVSFPGAVVRRATGTPFVGYAGAVWLLQVVCETLFDVLFANLPTSKAPPVRADVTTRQILSAAPQAQTDTGKGQNAVVTWTDEAKAQAERVTKRVPFFVRVSVNKKLRAESEKLARERRTDVDLAIVDEITARFSP